MAREGRSLWGNVLKNFVNSLRPRQIRGNLIGKDQFGNKYYEIPADPQRGKRHPSRWFQPEGGDAAFDQEKPAEWEAWLRGRRPQPPTDEEIEASVAMMKLKKENAKKLEREYLAEAPESLVQKKGADSFPKYGDEYEALPGSQEIKK